MATAAQQVISLRDIRELRAGFEGTVEYWVAQCEKHDCDMRSYFPQPQAIHAYGDTYAVMTARGARTLTLYYVTLDVRERHGYRCDCPGWTFNGHACSHFKPVLECLREQGDVPHVLQVIQARRDW